MQRNYALNPVAMSLHNSTLFEPQRTNHFEVYIFLPSALTGGDMNKLEDFRKYITLATQNFTLPNISTQPVDISYGNSKIHLAGQTDFGGADSFDCIDYIGADVEGILYSWQNLVFNPETSQMGWANTYKTDAKVLEYSPDGYCLATWILRGVWPSGVTYGSLDKNGNADTKKVQVKLSYDLGYRKFGDSTRNTYQTAATLTANNMRWKAQNAYAASNPGGPITAVTDNL